MFPFDHKKIPPKAVWLFTLSALGESYHQWEKQAFLIPIIPTRSRQAYSKQVCLWDLAQIIYIAFIIQVA